LVEKFSVVQDGHGVNSLQFYSGETPIVAAKAVSHNTGVLIMFTSLHPESNAKRPAAFVASLCLQSALLIILCAIPFPQRFGPSLRPNARSEASITPIYFQPDTVAAPSSPEAAPAEAQPAPEVPSEAKSATEQAANTQAQATDGATDDSAGTGDEAGLTPFPTWRMNAVPSGYTIMHHQVRNALAVFTPDPPILHGKFPEPARGKDIVMDVIIDDQGSITQVEVLQGIGYGVEQSIVETLRRWIFVPAKVNGMAIASHRQLRFHFPG
jgi:TonB family protein